MPSKCDCPVEVSEMRPFSAVSVGSEAFSHFCMRHRPEALTKQFDLLKCLPAVQETRVRSLGREDPLEKEMANHSGILAWKIPWTEDPGGCSPWLAKSPTRLNDFTVFILLYGGVGR